jgi:hypothetical protein
MKKALTKRRELEIESLTAVYRASLDEARNFLKIAAAARRKLKALAAE